MRARAGAPMQGREGAHPMMKSGHTVDEVKRIAELLTGMHGLLCRPGYLEDGVNDGGDALRELLCEARCQLDGVIYTLECPEVRT